MARTTLSELQLELDATEEAYVRRKLLLGGYGAGQEKMVKAWLAQREKDQAERRAAQDLAISSRTAFWTKVGAIAAVGATFFTYFAMFLTRGAG
jgi:hypothetical protein